MQSALAAFAKLTAAVALSNFANVNMTAMDVKFNLAVTILKLIFAAMNFKSYLCQDA